MHIHVYTYTCIYPTPKYVRMEKGIRLCLGGLFLSRVHLGWDVPKQMLWVCRV